MKKLLLTLAAAAVAVSTSFAVEGTNSPYTDPASDTIAGPVADILGMEVTNNLTDISFTLTVNGDISGGGNWGKYLIGISTGSTTSTNTGNGWARPINLNSPLGGMDYWIGSWVDGGGGAQLWNYTGSGTGGGTGNNWGGPTSLAGFSFLAGTNSTITFTATLASLGLAVNDTFYFDAYTTGGGSGDGAVDALANPNQSVAGWSDPYTSSTTGSGGPGLNSYQVVPEPSTYALLALGGAGLAGYIARRRSRK